MSVIFPVAWVDVLTMILSRCSDSTNNTCKCFPIPMIPASRLTPPCSVFTDKKADYNPEYHPENVPNGGDVENVENTEGVEKAEEA